MFGSSSEDYLSVPIPSVKVSDATDSLLRGNSNTIYDYIYKDPGLRWYYWCFGACAKSSSGGADDMMGKAWLAVMIIQSLFVSILGIYSLHVMTNYIHQQHHDHSHSYIAFSVVTYCQTIFHSVQTWVLIATLGYIRHRLSEHITPEQQSYIHECLQTCFTFALAPIPFLFLGFVVLETTKSEYSDSVDSHFMMSLDNMDLFGSCIQAWVLFFLLLDVNYVRSELVNLKSLVLSRTLTHQRLRELMADVKKAQKSTAPLYTVVVVFAYIGSLLAVFNLLNMMYFKDAQYWEIGLDSVMWILLLGRDAVLLLIALPQIVHVNELYTEIKRALADQVWESASVPDVHRVSSWMSLAERPIGFPLLGFYIDSGTLKKQVWGLCFSLGVFIITALIRQVK